MTQELHRSQIEQMAINTLRANTWRVTEVGVIAAGVLSIPLHAGFGLLPAAIIAFGINRLAERPSRYEAQDEAARLDVSSGNLDYDSAYLVTSLQNAQKQNRRHSRVAVGEARKVLKHYGASFFTRRTGLA